MRKKIFFIGVLVASLFMTAPVMAFKWDNITSDTPEPSTNKEILFRDIPWGINFNETKELLSDFELHGNTLDGLGAVTTDDVLKGNIYGDGNNYDGAISFYAMPVLSPEIDVAGYPIRGFHLYYTYLTENGFSFDDDNTVLYGAQYEFEEPQNLESMYSDLSSKLSEIYGEPSDTSSSVTAFGTKKEYTQWYGANDTVVALQSYDYGDEKSIYVSYAWLKGDELLKEADSALSDNKKNTETEIYGNGSTNGL